MSRARSAGAPHPYVLLLDDVLVRYDHTSRKYHVCFTKTIANQYHPVLRQLYARIDVCVFPGDLELARRYYRTRPLDLEELGFKAQDDQGHILRTELVHQYDSNLELDIVFEDARTGRRMPLRQGASRTVRYEIAIGDDQWGPFLARNVRVPVRTLSWTLVFPRRTANVHGIAIHPAGDAGPICPSMRHRRRLLLDEFSWKLSDPPVGARFRAIWSFADNREQRFEEKIRGEVAAGARAPEALPALVHKADDFRWFAWWDGTVYTLPPKPAMVIQYLWNRRFEGVEQVSQEELQSRCGFDSEVGLLFRRHRTVWGRVLQRTGKGMYGLIVPHR